MANPLVSPAILGIYQNKSRFQWIILTVAVIISVSTIYYTNVLVKQLKEREQRQIELFASAIEYTISENYRQDISFITEEILFQNNSIPTILINENGEIVSIRNIDIDSTSRSESKCHGWLLSSTQIQAEIIRWRQSVHPQSEEVFPQIDEG